MTKDQWTYVKECLDTYGMPVSLMCDGYQATFILSKTTNRRLSILTYVNGWLKGEWMLEDCEERRRFFRKKTAHLYKSKFRATLKRLSKKRLKELNIDPDAKIESYTPMWGAFSTLKRHLIANNKDISLIKD